MALLFSKQYKTRVQMVKHFIISAASSWCGVLKYFVVQSSQRCRLHLASPLWRSRVDESPTRSYTCTDNVALPNAIYYKTFKQATGTMILLVYVGSMVI